MDDGSGHIGSRNTVGAPTKRQSRAWGARGWQVELGRRLRELRGKQALSLYQVASRIGLHFSTIGKYERGVRQPSVKVLRRLAGLYKVDLAELLDCGDQALRADERQRLRERPDLQLLLDIARRLAPDQVLLLADLLRTLTAPARPGRADAPYPGAAGPGQEPPRRAAEGVPPAWRDPGAATEVPGAQPAAPRGARVRGTGAPRRPSRDMRTISRGPVPPLLPGVLPPGVLSPYRERGKGRDAAGRRRA